MKETAESFTIEKKDFGGMPVFMLTDIEGSTRLWDTHHQAMLPALLRHNAILEEHITRHGGRILELRGDGVKAVFVGRNPLQCVLDIQKSLGEVNWGEIGDLRIRIGLHSVPTNRIGIDYFIKDDKYYGPVLNHTARIMDAGHGGQILVSEQIYHTFPLPPGARWHDFGLHKVKSLDHPLQIYGLLHPDLPIQSFPPLRTGPIQPEMEVANLVSIRNNLPHQPTPFIGRESELTELEALITDSNTRLVTIVGLGGIGKTRLALAVAERVLKRENFSDGIYFIDLSPINKGGEIPLAVIEKLHIQLSGGEGREDTPKKQLLDYLGDKRMLLILDNTKSLPEGVQLISDILDAAPGVKILVTSREHLQIRMEHLYPITGWDLPDLITLEDAAEYSATRLFVSAAQRIQPNFKLVEDDLPHLTRICRLVSGIPLALELAAGWVELLPLSEIATEIDHGLEILETDLQDIPSRHRSIQIIFESTLQQLDPTERDIMEKLSVFRGGFTWDAAKQITSCQESCSAFLRILGRLVSKSLLQVDPFRERYYIYELLRKLTLAQLDSSGGMAAAHSDHASYYLDLLYQHEGEIKGGPEQKNALDEIEIDFANFRTAWDWALGKGNLEAIDRSLEAIFWFCRFRNQVFEGMDLFLQTEAQLTATADRSANALRRRIAARRIYLHVTSWFFDQQEAMKEIGLILTEARDAADQTEVDFALFTQGCLLMNLYPIISLKILEVSLAKYRNLGDKFYEGQVLDMISALYLSTGKSEDRVRIAQLRLELAGEVGDKLAMADARAQIGYVAELSGHYDKAAENYQEALPIFHEYGDRFHESEYSTFLGMIAFFQGELGKNQILLEKAKDLARHFNLDLPLAYFQVNYALILCAREQYEQAVKFCQDVAPSSYPSFSFFVHRGMAYAMYGMGNFADSRDHLYKAMDTAMYNQATGWMVQCLPAAALLAASENQLERSTELLALAFHHPAGYTEWLKVFPLISHLRALLEAELTSRVFDEIWERCVSEDLDETITTLFKEVLQGL